MLLRHGFFDRRSDVGREPRDLGVDVALVAERAPAALRGVLDGRHVASRALQLGGAEGCKRNQSHRVRIGDGDERPGSVLGGLHEGQELRTYAHVDPRGHGHAEGEHLPEPAGRRGGIGERASGRLGLVREEARDALDVCFE